MSHLTQMQDLIETVELISGKKLEDQHINLLKGFLKITFSDGYQRAANLAVDIIYKDKFHLSPEHYDWFIQVHHFHMKAMGTENQKKYSLPNVRDVKYDKKENCLKVYYDDIWWHYGRRGTWW